MSDDEVVVRGYVTMLGATTMVRPISEHDPLWQDASVEVAAVLRGNDINVGDTLRVRFASSRDVAWAHEPKLEVGTGVTLLARWDAEQEVYMLLQASGVGAQRGYRAERSIPLGAYWVVRDGLGHDVAHVDSKVEALDVIARIVLYSEEERWAAALIHHPDEPGEWTEVEDDITPTPQRVRPALRILARFSPDEAEHLRTTAARTGWSYVELVKRATLAGLDTIRHELGPEQHFPKEGKEEE